MGVDIGTTSVKAVAVDGQGEVVARARVAHGLHASHAGELAHDAAEAWRDGPLAAIDEIARALDGRHPVAGVDVAAMVPSLCAVDEAGHPVSSGLLYGDARAGGGVSPGGVEVGETGGFLAWLLRHHPHAAGFWPAQAVANAALGGRAVIDAATAFTTTPLSDGECWSAAIVAEVGLDGLDRLPRIEVGRGPVGRVERLDGALLGPGTIDALGEQLVAGADREGDVLVILGTTLIVWVLTREWREVPGLWTTPSVAPGMVSIGGPSNAGGFFVNWLAGTLGTDPSADQDLPEDPARVPVWLPYLRGERVPFHDPDRRGSLHDLDVGTGRSALTRAAFEASAFAVRHIVELSGVAPTRIVATGGGTNNRAWLQALADGNDLPVDVVAVPEGAALGAAWLARQAAGLEEPGALPSHWVRRAARVVPDARWAAAAGTRYRRYRELAG